MTFNFIRRALPLIPLAAVLGAGCTAGIEPTVVPAFVSTSVPASGDTVFVASDAWATATGASFELFSVGGGSRPTQLTFCPGCQVLSASPSLDRNRVALRRVDNDTNRDNRLDDLDRVSLLLLDLGRQIEGPFLPDGWSNSSVDWTSDGSFLIHTSSPDGGPDDLYQIDSNALNNQRLITTPNVRERGARLDAAVTRAVYERIDGIGAGRSEIWMFGGGQGQLTNSGITGELLPGTLYLVGSDAGPSFSPDGNTVVFRRLTSTAAPGGTWDILTVPAGGGTPTVLTAGAQFRSAPDWGREGIVFSESNPATGGTDVVVIDPSTRARRVLQSFGRGYRAESPRWIAGIAG